ncbi:MAG: hypothetical protein ABW046_13165, partial [Actinoplanes sp.]
GRYREVMKRLLTLIALLTVAVVGVTASPAQAAYPESSFHVQSGFGAASGHITWFNRSVGISGYVLDLESSPGGYSQVRFHFYLYENETAEVATTTRTAGFSERTDYSFTQPGPEGGIRLVVVRVCSTNGACDERGWKRSRADVERAF